MRDGTNGFGVRDGANGFGVRDGDNPGMRDIVGCHSARDCSTDGIYGSSVRDGFDDFNAKDRADNSGANNGADRSVMGGRVGVQDVRGVGSLSVRDVADESGTWDGADGPGSWVEVDGIGARGIVGDSDGGDVIPKRSKFAASPAVVVEVDTADFPILKSAQLDVANTRG